MQETLSSTNASALLQGHSGEWWDFYVIVSLCAAAIVAVALVVTTRGSISAHKREAKIAERKLVEFKIETAARVDEANARAAEANERTANAQAETAKANARAAEANEKAANAQAETAKTNEQLAIAKERLLHERRLTANERWRLVRLEKAVLPRSLTKEQFSALITAIKGLGPVNLAIVEKPESKNFGRQLMVLFSNAGVLGNVISLPGNMPVSGVLTYYTNHAGEKLAETMWRVAQIGGAWTSVMPYDLVGIPANANCVIIGDNDAALQPGNGQPGEGIDEYGDPVPAPEK